MTAAQQRRAFELLAQLRARAERERQRAYRESHRRTPTHWQNILTHSVVRAAVRVADGRPVDVVLAERTGAPRDSCGRAIQRAIEAGQIDPDAWPDITWGQMPVKSPPRAPGPRGSVRRARFPSERSTLLPTAERNRIIREWAREHGYQVPTTINEEIEHAYFAAHPERWPNWSPEA